MADTLEQLPGSGVDALINKLRQEGIARGEAQATAILQDARSQAAKIIEEARQQAQAMVGQAQQESAALKSAGQEALELTFRDLILKLRDRLTTRFREEVQRLVGAQIDQEAFMQRLILEAVGRARAASGLDEAAAATVLLPAAVVGVDDLKKRPDELKEGSISHFVVSLMGNLVCDGFQFDCSDKVSGGIRIYLKDGATVVDFTDQALAAILLEHLQPRFRALLEGRVG